MLAYTRILLLNTIFDRINREFRLLLEIWRWRKCPTERMYFCFSRCHAEVATPVKGVLGFLVIYYLATPPLKGKDSKIGHLRVKLPLHSFFIRVSGSKLLIPQFTQPVHSRVEKRPERKFTSAFLDKVQEARA